MTGVWWTFRLWFGAPVFARTIGFSNCRIFHSIAKACRLHPMELSSKFQACTSSACPFKWGSHPLWLAAPVATQRWWCATSRNNGTLRRATPWSFELASRRPARKFSQASDTWQTRVREWRRDDASGNSGGTSKREIHHTETRASRRDGHSHDGRLFSTGPSARTSCPSGAASYRALVCLAPAAAAPSIPWRWPCRRPFPDGYSDAPRFTTLVAMGSLWAARWNAFLAISSVTPSIS